MIFFIVLSAVAVGYFGRMHREESYWGPLNHQQGRSWDWRPMLYPMIFGKRTQRRWDDA